MLSHVSTYFNGKQKCHKMYVTDKPRGSTASSSDLQEQPNLSRERLEVSVDRDDIIFCISQYWQMMVIPLNKYLINTWGNISYTISQKEPNSILTVQDWRHLG